MGNSDRSRSRSRSRSRRRTSKHSKRELNDKITRLENVVSNLASTVKECIQRQDSNRRQSRSRSPHSRGGTSYRNRSRSRSKSTVSRRSRSTSSRRNRYQSHRSSSSRSSSPSSWRIKTGGKSQNENITNPSSSRADLLTSNVNSINDDILCLNPDDINEFQDLLGDVPNNKNQMGTKVNSALADRINAILRNGIPKEERERIQKNFLQPENVETSGPKLNPELKKAITPVVKDNDGELLSLQNHLAVGLNGVAKTVSTLMEVELIDKKHVISSLSDVVRYLSGSHYAMSIYRRKQVRRSIKNDNMKEALGESPIYPMLFGSDMNNVMKSAETAAKIGRNLLQKPSIMTGNSGVQKYHHVKPHRPSSLNFNRPSGNRNQKKYPRDGQKTRKY